MKYFYWTTQTLMWPFFWLVVLLFYRVSIFGREHLRGIRSPLLIITNHISVLDPFLIGMVLPWGSPLFPIRPMSEDLHFKGKYLEFLRKLRVLKVFFALTGSFPSRRGQGIERAIEIPVQILLKGGTVTMFPEGRVRYHQEGLGPLYHGASTMALSAGANVLPMWIKKSRRRISINIGQIFRLPEIKPEAGTELFRQKLSELAQNLG